MLVAWGCFQSAASAGISKYTAGRSSSPEHKAQLFTCRSIRRNANVPICYGLPQTRQGRSMYIAHIHIRNFRCFRDTAIDFRPGLNVIIGENNAGKTTLLKALSLVFDRRGRTRPTVHDFHRLMEPLDAPPRISVAVTIRSSPNDTEADRALVASWLTRLETPWEAQLTYTYFLPEQHQTEFTKALNATSDRDKYFEVVEEFLPKFVSRVYAGNPETLVAADAEALGKFDCQFLDALRDVEKEMFAGNTPLFRSMLEEVLDLEMDADEKRTIRGDFRTKSNSLRQELIGRLDTDKLFELVKVTGAADGGHPKLHGGVDESDLISALRLYIDRQQFMFPATHQGLGYNNLLYISLMLASLRFRASEKRHGQNAAIFPMLLVEEPEAHLHPALQYKLLSHIVSRVESEPRHNRQVFVTTHSTHVTSAARLDPIICLSLKSDGGIGVSYPSRLFPSTPEGEASRGYVERYLDATKSTMLFAKATVLVEGIAEQLIIPALAATLKRSFDQNHVAVVRVDGVTFKHFLPLFGGGTPPESIQFALERPVACIVDGDPSRKEKAAAKPRWKACFPFQLGQDDAKYEYRALSPVVTNLNGLKNGRANIGVFHGQKTFEFDLALCNHKRSDLITKAIKNADALVELVASPHLLPTALEGVLIQDEVDSLASIDNADDKHRQRFGAIYLRCAEECKGEHAFALELILRKLPTDATSLACPDYIRHAIELVTQAPPASGATP